MSGTEAVTDAIAELKDQLAKAFSAQDVAMGQISLRLHKIEQRMEQIEKSVGTLHHSVEDTSLAVAVLRDYVAEEFMGVQQNLHQYAIETNEAMLNFNINTAGGLAPLQIKRLDTIVEDLKRECFDSEFINYCREVGVGMLNLKIVELAEYDQEYYRVALKIRKQEAIERLGRRAYVVERQEERKRLQLYEERVAGLKLLQEQEIVGRPQTTFAPLSFALLETLALTNDSTIVTKIGDGFKWVTAREIQPLNKHKNAFCFQVNQAGSAESVTMLVGLISGSPANYQNKIGALGARSAVAIHGTAQTRRFSPGVTGTVKCNSKAGRFFHYESFYGIMFNISSTFDVILDDLSFIPGAGAGNVAVSLFFREGTMQGVETDPSQWTVLFAGHLKLQDGQEVRLCDLGVPMKALATNALYLHTSDVSGVRFWQPDHGPVGAAFSLFDTDGVIQTYCGYRAADTPSHFKINTASQIAFRGKIGYRMKRSVEGPIVGPLDEDRRPTFQQPGCCITCTLDFSTRLLRMYLLTLEGNGVMEKYEYRIEDEFELVEDDVYAAVSISDVGDSIQILPS